MTVEKTRSLPWFALSVSAALLTMLVMLTVSMISGWASTVNSQIRESERRIGTLERQYAVIEQLLNQNNGLLREHMGKTQ